MKTYHESIVFQQQGPLYQFRNMANIAFAKIVKVYLCEDL